MRELPREPSPRPPLADERRDRYGAHDPAVAAETAPHPTARRPPRLWLHGLLFLLTVLSTLAAGAIQQGLNPFTQVSSLVAGIPFSFTLMAILLTHEMGHYVMSAYHGVPASLPYFIPAPSFIGTFGAFIRMDAPILNRRALIDIGASGPLAGFIVAAAAVWFGLQWSTIVDAGDAIGLRLGSPLVLTGIEYLVLGALPENQDVLLHPVAFAGWIGMLVTMLNLIPIGQLDGGHVAYAIFGERHREISILMVLTLILLGFWGWPGWFVWAVLPLIFGLRHPPLQDSETPLDPARRWIGWASVALFIATFIPVPFS